MKNIEKHKNDGSETSKKCQTLKNTILEKCIFCWFPGRPQRYPTLCVLISNHGKIAKPGKMLFLLFCGRAKTLEKFQNLEKCIFGWFPGGPQRYPTLSVLIQNHGQMAKLGKLHFLLVKSFEKLQNLEKCIFCWFAGGAPPYPTLSVLIPNLGKIAKRGKMHFFLVCGKAKTLEKLQTWKNAFFAGLWPQRYPTLSVLIANHGKIAKPGKMYVLLACRRAKTLEKLQHMETCIFCWFAGGPHPIQRYPSLSQTWEKLQNVEKCIFCWFPGGPQGYPTLSVLIPNHGKNAKPGKMHFLWFQKHKKNDEISKTTFLGNAEK